MSEEIKNRKSWVYDIETIKSVFTYTAINIDTLEVVKYVIHKERNDLFLLIKHLKQCKGLIGFNNLNFDYPIIHMILTDHINWLNFSNEEIIDIIYRKAQYIINGQNQEGFFPSIRDKEVIIPQLDLFRVWHYNNKARMTSLKSLQISMNYPNVLDMPIHHSKEDVTIEEVEEILKYNLNDVLSTFEFYKKSIEKVALRKQIQAKYKIPCINYSDSKIGESLLLSLYSNQTGENPWDIKKLRSYRSSIAFKDIILNYIKFESKEFNELLSYLKNRTITETKKAFEKSVRYKGFQYDYGTGGIHGCIKSGIYESDDKYIIIDADVASLYPNVAIKNRMYIEHLGETFIDLYDKDIVQERLRAKKAGEMSISDALKLSANSVYGKSNDENSFLYDPKYTMATTINGQLLLTMLAEMIVDGVKDITVLQVNTDGITVRIPRDQQEVYYTFCKEWEKKTNLELEYVEYSKMIIRDVNNYMAVSSKGKVKQKGAFEVDKVVGNEPAYHKDNSFRVIPIAIEKYFVEGIPVSDTIYNHNNIYDFCGRQKFGKDSSGEIHNIKTVDGISYDEALELYHKEWVDYEGDSCIKRSWIDQRLPYDRMAADKRRVIQGIINDSRKSIIDIEEQQKNVRYYISKSGKSFVKRYTKGSIEAINKGFQVEIFNEYIEKDIKDYNINYSFYINEAYKIIYAVQNDQIALL